jgi:ubiquinone/menaquinone biosynthesis C-methylase UbiE
LALQGKRVLVPGCGFGDDAILLAELGAKVSAFDLSDSELDIARRRADLHGVHIDFRVMPAESLAYEDNTFDAAIFVDILHHVDIPLATAETSRVLRPNGWIIGNELYTHSVLDQVRYSRFVTHTLYPRMCHFIYGTDRPYITVDEHKINEREFALLLSHIERPKVHWFNALIDRLLPARFVMAAKADRTFLSTIGRSARFLAGRVVFYGTNSKSTTR